MGESLYVNFKQLTSSGVTKLAGMIQNLIFVMNEQVERHTELYGLSLEEKDAIVQNDVETLQKLVNLKNMVITQNNRLEKQRLSLVSDIAEVLGLADKDISFSELIEIMEGKPEQEELRVVGKRLKDIVEQLKGINDLNKSLLESSLEFVEYSLNALRSTIEPEPVDIPTTTGRRGNGANVYDA